MRVPLTLEVSVREALERAVLVGEGGGFVRVLAEEALASARGAERAGEAGALGGVPVAVKDLIAVAGCPIGAGSASRASAPVELHDGAIVAALRAAGAVVVGTVALHELAYGVTGLNQYQGTPLNPLSPGAIPGGSSSGCAVAVATGGAVLAIGTDTGGSVRIPAALCGVVGFKPRRGEYPTAGVLPLAPTLDHVGLLARRVAPIRRAHAALRLDPGEASLPRRVGIDICGLGDASAAVAAPLDELLGLLEAAGVALVDVQLPDPASVRQVGSTVLLAEAAAVHGDRYRADAGAFGKDVAARIRAGLALEPGEHGEALLRAQQLQRATTAALSEVDVLLGPTVGCLAPGLDEATDRAVSDVLWRNTIVHNLVGSAALSLPLPGTPGVGAQLAATSSAAVLGMAHAVERMLG